jgi:hypothetical protein
MQSFGIFDAPLKQKHHIKNAKVVHYATVLVIRSFFAYGSKQVLGTINDSKKLKQQFQERWAQFCSCVILENNENKKNESAVWETLHFCVKTLQHDDDDDDDDDHYSNKSDSMSIDQEKFVKVTCLILKSIKNSDFNISDKGMSPLLYAMNNKLNVHIMTKLRKYGADFLVSEGSVAMTAIVKTSYDMLIHITLHHTNLVGINSRIINSTNYGSGGTALNYVCSTETNTETISNKIFALLTSGMNPLILNDDFLSPRDILEQRFHALNSYSFHSDIERTMSHLCDAEKMHKNRPKDTWQETVRNLIKKNGIPNKVANLIMKQLYVAQSNNDQPSLINR